MRFKFLLHLLVLEDLGSCLDDDVSWDQVLLVLLRLQVATLWLYGPKMHRSLKNDLFTGPRTDMVHSNDVIKNPEVGIIHGTVAYRYVYRYTSYR
jgi:hypothetical protein